MEREYRVKATVIVDTVSITAVGAVEKAEEELKNDVTLILRCEAHNPRPLNHATLGEVKRLLREQVEAESTDSAKAALHCLLAKINTSEADSGLLEYTVEAVVVVEVIAESEVEAGEQAVLLLYDYGRAVYDVELCEEETTNLGANTESTIKG